jgi:hypothetical protein
MQMQDRRDKCSALIFFLFPVANEYCVPDLQDLLLEYAGDEAPGKRFAPHGMLHWQRRVQGGSAVCKCAS